MDPFWYIPFAGVAVAVYRSYQEMREMRESRQEYLDRSYREVMAEIEKEAIA